MRSLGKEKALAIPVSRSFLMNRSERIRNRAAVTFMTRKPEKMVPEVEKMLRKDLRVETLPACQVLPTESGGVPARSLLAEVPRETWELPVTVRVGGLISMTRGSSNVELLYYLYFKLAQPRRMELQAFIAKFKLAATVHRLAYVVPLSKPVGGQVSLDPVKMQGLGTSTSPFSGHAQTAARLNRDNALLKLANQLAVASMNYDRQSLGIERCLVIYPQPTGSLLLLHTLPRMMMWRWRWCRLLRPLCKECASVKVTNLARYYFQLHKWLPKSRQSKCFQIKHAE